jgi:hypothetical protein
MTNDNPNQTAKPTTDKQLRGYYQPVKVICNAGLATDYSEVKRMANNRLIALNGLPMFPDEIFYDFSLTVGDIIGVRDQSITLHADGRWHIDGE